MYDYSPRQAQNQFPDILSAPAPVLRDHDILIDGETVAHLSVTDEVPNRPSPSSRSFRSPNNTATSPAMSSLTTSPTTASPPSTARSSPGYHPSPYDPYSFETATTIYQHQHPQQQPVVIHQTHDMPYQATRPPQVEKMRQRRKVATAAAGVVGGIAGLAVLGPVGALAGGVGSAMLTKQAGKRMERKQTERIAAQRHAAEEARYGRTVPALQDDAGLL